MTKKKKILLILAILLLTPLLLIIILYFKYQFFIDPFLKTDKTTVNILILGKGGGDHEAPDLTDTIILAMVKDKKINLVSLPRDIWVPEIRAKLNSAYYWGKQKDQGFLVADDAIKSITGVTVDKNLVVDFSVFEDFIDGLGGVEVDVQNAFVDEKYPVVGKEADPCLACRYQTISFGKGKQLMSGDRALQFVRSRNSEGDEGTDIAREARQQLVITAVKNKILNPKNLSPKQVKNLVDLVLNHIETDIQKQDLGSLVRVLFNSKDSLNSYTIPEDFLIHPPTSRKYDNLYVFIPKDGSWKSFQEWIKSL